MNDELRRDAVGDIVNTVLTFAEDFCDSVDSRPAFIEAVIAGLREEMGK